MIDSDSLGAEPHHGVVTGDECLGLHERRWMVKST